MMISPIESWVPGLSNWSSDCKEDINISPPTLISGGGPGQANSYNCMWLQQHLSLIYWNHFSSRLLSPLRLSLSLSLSLLMWHSPFIHSLFLKKNKIKSRNLWEFTLRQHVSSFGSILIRGFVLHKSLNTGLLQNVWQHSPCFNCPKRWFRNCHCCLFLWKIKYKIRLQITVVFFFC